MNLIDTNPETPLIATDIALFTVTNGQIHVALLQYNDKDPHYPTHWKMIGGLMKKDQSLDDSAKFHLSQKTGIDPQKVFIEQIHTFGSVERDKKRQAVSVVYLGLCSEPLELKTLPKYQKTAWLPINNLPEMAYDHKDIVLYAYRALQSKFRYSNIAYALLPEIFTFTELQKLYEIISDKKFEKRNFRKKVKSLEMIEKVGKKQSGVQNRPAELYRFSQQHLENILLPIFKQ